MKKSPPKDASPPKRTVGRPKFVPTAAQREEVQLMRAIGIPEADMCRIFINPQTGKPLTPKTLRVHFRRELDDGEISANTKVVGGLFKNATTPTKIYPGGNPIAQIFWSKCRLRWRQSDNLTLKVPLSAPDSAPAATAALDQEVVADNEFARRIAFTLEVAARKKQPA